MSIIYIISAVVLAIVLTSIVFVLIGKIEHKNRRLNLNWFLLMMLIAISCILTMVLVYHNQYDITEEGVGIAVNEAYQRGLEEGKASASHTYPSNEEIEAWMTSTEEVVVATNNGEDPAIHIIDGNGEEWVLVVDEVIEK